jgi:hypothetical protein
MCLRSTYFRTTGTNCFVSLATLNDTAAPQPDSPLLPVTAGPKSLRRGAAALLPPCGPVPHLRLEERPPSALPGEASGTDPGVS